MIIKPRVSKDTFIKTTLVRTDDGTSLKLDIPFPITGQTIKCEGQDVTYSLSDLKNEGKTVVAWICYDDDEQGAEVAKFAGLIGENPLTDATYKVAYPVTKADSLAVTTGVGLDAITTKYAGVDKDDSVLFCERLYK